MSRMLWSQIKKNKWKKRWLFQLSTGKYTFVLDGEQEQEEKKILENLKLNRYPASLVNIASLQSRQKRPTDAYSNKKNK